MTVAELITHLQKMDPKTVVARYDARFECWRSMDGWYPRIFDVVRGDEFSDIYRMANHGDDQTVELLELGRE